jgi:O-antigen ligase/tetratricopeptide (TPR) repeat protein
MPRRRRRHSRSSAESQDSAEAVALPTVPEAPKWVMVLGTLLPLAATFLGTGNTGWELGFAALGVGLLLLLAPPKHGIPMVFALLLLGFFAVALIPLLPLKWEARPEWWTTLARDYGVQLSSPWSGQPSVTLEALARILVGLSWLMWWLLRAPDYLSQRVLMRVLAAGISLLAIVSLGFRSVGWEPVLWDNPLAPQFGPMANRNVFAGLMSLGLAAALASAYDLHRRHHSGWLFYAAAMIPLLGAVLVNRSRAGIALFVITILLWLMTSSFRQGMMQRLAIAGSIILIVTTSMMIFGRQLLERFVSENESASGIITNDGRLPVFREALAMAESSPWLGWGAGNFEAVFGMMNQMKDTRDRFLHPESDWLWMLTETGYIATGLLAVLLFLLVRWCRLPEALRSDVSHGERRMHTAAAIGTGLAVAHSLVNPVLHCLPFLLCLGVMSSIAILPVNWITSRRLPSAGLFRLAGLICMTAGAVWLMSVTGSSLLFGETASTKQLAMASEFIEQKNAASALAACDKAVSSAPLKWECYFERASIKLETGQHAAKAADDFAIARFLEPSLPLIPYSEGQVWLKFQPSHAISAWGEALRRQPALYRAQFFNTMVAEVHSYPELRPAMRALVVEPQMMVQYMSWATTAEDRVTALRELLARDPDLEQLQPKERKYVFRIWVENDDKELLMKRIQEKTDWMRDGWEFLALHMADAGDPRGAFELAVGILPPPLKGAISSTVPLEELEKQYAAAPGDVRHGLSLYRAQMENGKFREALVTLTQVTKAGNAPKYLDYELAKVHARLGDFVRAWQAIRAYMEKNPAS